MADTKNANCGRLFLWSLNYGTDYILIITLVLLLCEDYYKNHTLPPYA